MFPSSELVWILKSARRVSFGLIEIFLINYWTIKKICRLQIRIMDISLQHLTNALTNLEKFSIRQAVNKGFGNGSCSVEWEKSHA